MENLTDFTSLASISSVASVVGVIHIAAAIALLNGLFTTFGQSKVACQAMESIARQPEAADDIRSAMVSMVS